MRVAGVEIGQISDVEVDEGKAVVEVEIEGEFDDVIREDATALLRPRTGLKDMLIEVDPGQGEVLDPAGASGWRTRCPTSIPTKSTPRSTPTPVPT